MQADGPLTGAPLSFPSPGGGPGAPERALLPRFDQLAPFSGGPALSYKAPVGDPAAVIVIQGENLTGIVSVDVSTDVNVSGNSPTPPSIVGAPVVTDTAITVTLDTTPATAGDIWGIILEDGDGNAYAAPSPLKLWAPL